MKAIGALIAALLLAALPSLDLIMTGGGIGVVHVTFALLSFLVLAAAWAMGERS